MKLNRQPRIATDLLEWHQESGWRGLGWIDLSWDRNKYMGINILYYSFRVLSLQQNTSTNKRKQQDYKST